MPRLLLALSLFGALCTFNALRPTRQWQLISFSFVAGWLTGELAPFVLAAQAAVTGVLIAFGALAAWPGWLGLGITAASVVGLIAIQIASLRTESVVEHALREGLGPDYRDHIAPGIAQRLAKGLSWRTLLLPFYLRDRRVERIKDLAYVEGGGRRNQLDVYRPRAGAKDAPVLFQIHGGAWVVGDKGAQALPLMLHLAANGWVCVAANYRLTPRATFPDHLVDCKLALAWIREHIAEYGGNPELVVVTGGSAGGHLASLVALTANDPRYQPGFESADTSVMACVSFYGVYDLVDTFEAVRFPRRGADWFEKKLMGATLRENRGAYAQGSPMSHVGADAPPFFIVHGQADNLVPVAQARRFAEALRASSRQPVVYAELAGASHAFEVFHSVRTGHVVNGVDRFLAWLYSARRAKRNAGA